MKEATISAQIVKQLKGRGFLRNKETDCFSARVITVNGRLTVAQQRCIADAAERYGTGVVSFTSRLTVEVPGIPYDKIEDFCAAIAQEGLETGGTGPKVRPIVSCKGTLCHFGRIDTFGLSEEIHNRFYKGYRDTVLPHKFKIAVGGCPNNCVKPDINDLGVIGQLQPKVDPEKCHGCKRCAIEMGCPIHSCHSVDGVLKLDPSTCNRCGRCVGRCPFGAVTEQARGYKITLGGRWGKQVGRGKALNKLFTDRGEVLSIIEKAILFYREEGIKGERLAQTIERVGFEHAEQVLLSDEILARKEEILSGELKG